MATLYELLEKAVPPQPEEKELAETMKNQELLKKLLKGEIDAEVAPSYKEAAMTHDYLTLFKNVVSDMTLKPVEPIMIGQDLLATTINMPGVFTEVRIPAYGALKAFEIGEGQELTSDSSLVA